MQMLKSNLATTLRRLPLFNDLSEAELALVAERAVRRQYIAGTIIFSEGESCRELLIVEEGTVKILKTASNGRQQLIGIERAGNSLAEVPVLMRGDIRQPQKLSATLHCCTWMQSTSAGFACDTR